MSSPPPAQTYILPVEEFLTTVRDQRQVRNYCQASLQQQTLHSCILKSARTFYTLIVACKIFSRVFMTPHQCLELAFRSSSRHVIIEALLCSSLSRKPFSRFTPWPTSKTPTSATSRSCASARVWRGPFAPHADRSFSLNFCIHAVPSSRLSSHQRSVQIASCDASASAAYSSIVTYFLVKSFNKCDSRSFSDWCRPRKLGGQQLTPESKGAKRFRCCRPHYFDFYQLRPQWVKMFLFFWIAFVPTHWA